MKKLESKAIIRGGQLIPMSPDGIRAFAASFDEETEMKITIEKDYSNKSDLQMGYYFGVVVKAAVKESGYSRDEVDGVFCKNSLTQCQGTSKEYVKSKGKCTTVEINQLIDDSRDMLAKIWGISVPDPDKDWRNK
jgi:hypothetical protein